MLQQESQGSKCRIYHKCTDATSDTTAMKEEAMKAIKKIKKESSTYLLTYLVLASSMSNTGYPNPLYFVTSSESLNAKSQAVTPSQ